MALCGVSFDRRTVRHWTGGHLPAAVDGLRIGYFLAFPSDHHRTYTMPLADTTAIPAGPPGGALVILVIIVDSAEDLAKTHGGAVIATLHRAGDGLVAVVANSQEDATGWTDGIPSLLGSRRTCGLHPDTSLVNPKQRGLSPSEPAFTA